MRPAYIQTHLTSSSLSHDYVVHLSPNHQPPLGTIGVGSTSTSTSPTSYGVTNSPNQSLKSLSRLVAAATSTGISPSTGVMTSTVGAANAVPLHVVEFQSAQKSPMLGRREMRVTSLEDDEAQEDFQGYISRALRATSTASLQGIERALQDITALLQKLESICPLPESGITSGRSTPPTPLGVPVSASPARSSRGTNTYGSGTPLKLGSTRNGTASPSATHTTLNRSRSSSPNTTALTTPSAAVSSSPAALAAETAVVLAAAHNNAASALSSDQMHQDSGRNGSSADEEGFTSSSPDENKGKSSLRDNPQSSRRPESTSNHEPQFVHVLIKFAGTQEGTSPKDPKGHRIRCTKRGEALVSAYVIYQSAVNGWESLESLAHRFSDCDIASSMPGGVVSISQLLHRYPSLSEEFRRHDLDVNELLEKMTVGAVSPILETEYGLHILKRVN